MRRLLVHFQFHIVGTKGLILEMGWEKRLLYGYMRSLGKIEKMRSDMCDVFCRILSVLGWAGVWMGYMSVDR